MYDSVFVASCMFLVTYVLVCLQSKKVQLGNFA